MDIGTLHRAKVADSRCVYDDRRLVEGNWLDVIRGNGQLAWNAELGTATMVAIQMAVERSTRTKPAITCWFTPKNGVDSRGPQTHEASEQLISNEKTPRAA